MGEKESNSVYTYIHGRVGKSSSCHDNHDLILVAIAGESDGVIPD